MPSDLLLKSANAVHRAMIKISGGRLGWTGADMPVLELTTIGRKSGKPRTVMLTSPYQEGTTMAIVASRGGDDQHPAWFLNLRDNPDVEVTTKDQREAAHARTCRDLRGTGPPVAADHGEVQELRRLPEEDRPRDPGRPPRTGRMKPPPEEAPDDAASKTADLGGDSACWAELVCDICGAVVTATAAAASGPGDERDC